MVKKMKAWVLHGIDNFRLETVKEPALEDEEVLVEVKAAGICGSDIPRIYQTGAYSYPLIPGHEFSGAVVKVGAGADKSWMGQRVGIFPLIPCRECGPCQKKQYEMCRHYSYLGSRRNGGFAEYVAVPSWNLLKLPEQVTFEEAAMLEPMAVAVHAMRRLAPAADNVVTVCGLGAIGMLLLMFLKEAGVRKILAIGNKEFQRQAVWNMGLAEENYCDSKEQDAGRWIMEHTNGSGTDIFFECVGKKETYTLGVQCTAPAGKILLVGNPYSDMKLEKDVYWKILRNQLTVAGTWNSSFVHGSEDDWNYVMERLVKKTVSPLELISHRLSFEELEKGARIMRDKTEDYLKVMVTSAAKNPLSKHFNL